MKEVAQLFITLYYRVSWLTSQVILQYILENSHVWYDSFH
jgi:hypothetical protein